MSDKDFDRAAFDEIVRHQLSDLSEAVERIEVDGNTARIIEALTSDMERQNPCPEFEPLKDRLFRMLWIRDENRDS